MKKTKGRDRKVASSRVVRGHRSVRAKPVRVIGWPARIAEARRRGRFTFQDALDASAWPTCACGKLDAAIRRHGRVPADQELRLLGGQFSDAVIADGFDSAERTIRAITKRAAEVLREQRK